MYRKHRRGNYALITVFAVTALLAMTSLAIDTLWVEYTRMQSRYAAEAGSRAALTWYRRSGSTNQASSVAKTVMARNTIGSSAVSSSSASVVFGDWSWSSSPTFTTTPPTPSAVQVSIRQRTPVLVGWAGTRNITPATSATAAIRPREIVVAQDTTLSVAIDDEISFGRSVDRALLTRMNDAPGPVDKVGLVTFSFESELYDTLSPVRNNASVIDDQWKAVTYCDLVDGVSLPWPFSYWNDEINSYGNNSMPRCFSWSNSGTRPSEGISRARTELASSRDNIAAIRSIVLVTDGRATNSLLDELVGTGTLASNARNAAYLQAGYALDDNISVFCVWRDSGSLSDDVADFIGDALDLSSGLVEAVMDALGISDMLEDAADVLSTQGDARNFCRYVVSGGPGETNTGFGEYENGNASGASASSIARAIVDQVNENTPIAIVK